MVNLTEAYIQGGHVNFVRGEEPVPASSRVEGNVTYHTEAVEGSPDKFEVSFWTSATFEDDGGATRWFFQLPVQVTGMDRNQSFVDIEAAAADKLVPMLRSVADALEKQIDEYNAKREENGTA